MQQSCCIVWHRVAARSETVSAASLSSHEIATEMATLSTKNGTFHIRFRWAGRHYRRTLRTRDPREAEALLYSIKNTLCRLNLGQLIVPAGVQAADFIASGGSLTTPQPAGSPNSSSTITLRAAIAEYHELRYTIADTTLSTEKIHLKHLQTSLAAKLDKPCSTVIHRDLDRHLSRRLKEVRADTVGKERETIVQFFKWAVEQDYLTMSPAAKLTKIKGRGDPPNFQTMAEIQAVIDRGGLSHEEILAQWECLYLAPAEIAELLQTVRTFAREDYAPLLHVIPAFTGMRRGEILRLRWQDVHLDRGILVARSRKQSRQTREVARDIDLHPELSQLLREWKARRPRGQWVICDRDTLEPLDSKTTNRAFRQPLLATHWCLDRRRRKFKLGFHTLRHSFASNLAAAGVDQRIIDQWMGHQTEAMRRRYRHLFPKLRQSAIESFSLMAKTPATIVGT